MKYTSSKHSWHFLAASLGTVTVAAFWGVGLATPRPLWAALIFGAVVAGMSGPILLTPVLYFMRKRAGIPYGDQEPKTSEILGFVERLVIFGAFVLGFEPQAIAGWITLKTVSQWKGWEEDPEIGQHRFGEGRARFHIFLVGTSLSIICALGGALFALWLYRPDQVSSLMTFGVIVPSNTATPVP